MGFFFFFFFFFVGYGSSKRMWLNKTNRVGLWVIFSFIWAGADIGYFMGWGGVGWGIQNFKTRSWGYSKLPVETER
jgi:hypothetical protein